MGRWDALAPKTYTHVRARDDMQEVIQERLSHAYVFSYVRPKNVPSLALQWIRWDIGLSHHCPTCQARPKNPCAAVDPVGRVERPTAPLTAAA